MQTSRQCEPKSSRDLADVEDGKHVTVIGIVTGRQRPSTASGVTFVTLEDEFGMVNVVVWRDLAERYRPALMGSKLLQVKGKLEDQSGVMHLIAGHLKDRSDLLDGLDVRSGNFHRSATSRPDLWGDVGRFRLPPYKMPISKRCFNGLPDSEYKLI